MARKELQIEEIAKLQENPYVDGVAADKVFFTAEFKRAAYRQLMSGKTMRCILREYGIDPEILGDRRIWSIAYKLRKDGSREGGFEDLRTNNSRKPAKQSVEQTLAARVEQLEHELAYTRQEVEFIKKIRTADMEARIQWESRQHRK